MKHTFSITAMLILIFLAAQYVGLAVVDNYIDHEKTAETGTLTVSSLPDIAGMSMDRPEFEENTSFLPIMAALLIGTVAILIIIHFKKINIWKLWFFFAISICLIFSIYAFVKNVQGGMIIANVLGIGLAMWKVLRPNPWVHNLTEVFIYGGLAALLFPVVSIWAALALLGLVSLYDMYAVWQSKHMVKLAEFQNDSGMFAGIMLRYGKPAAKSVGKTVKKAAGEVKSAVLGGGDIGFPLLFAASILKIKGIAVAAIIPPFAAAGLLMLLLLAKKDKFYPAMPFITAGCLVGWAVTLLF